MESRSRNKAASADTDITDKHASKSVIEADDADDTYDELFEEEFDDSTDEIEIEKA